MKKYIIKYTPNMRMNLNNTSKIIRILSRIFYNMWRNWIKSLSKRIVINLINLKTSTDSTSPKLINYSKLKIHFRSALTPCMNLFKIVVQYNNKNQVFYGLLPWSIRLLKSYSIHNLMSIKQKKKKNYIIKKFNHLNN